MNFERGKSVSEAIGVGLRAIGLHVTSCKHYGGDYGGLTRTKKKTTRKVLRNLEKSDAWYAGYDRNVFIELCVRHESIYNEIQGSENVSGTFRPMSLAGRTLIFQGRIYQLKPLPEET